MKIGQYCQRQRCKHVESEQFWHDFALRGFVSDSWAFLFLLRVLDKAEYSAVEFTLNSAIVSYRIPLCQNVKTKTSDWNELKLGNATW